MHVEGDLEILMVRYQRGDRDAATDLVHRMSPRLHRFLGAPRATRVDADDLLQETWLRIHNVRHTYRAGEPVLPWFYAIARHVRVDQYRKAFRAARFGVDLEAHPEAAVTSAQFDQAHEVEQLLSALTPSQREVLELVKVAGLSLEEAARATSSTVGSVKQKVHRAYTKLRQKAGAMAMERRRPGVAG